MGARWRFDRRLNITELCTVPKKKRETQGTVRGSCRGLHLVSTIAYHCPLYSEGLRCGKNMPLSATTDVSKRAGAARERTSTLIEGSSGVVVTPQVTVHSASHAATCVLLQ